MVRLWLISSLLILSCATAWTQTCTISGSGTINFTAATCVETGLAPVSGDNIVVPVAVDLNINNIASNPVHTGNIQVFGTLTNNKANALWNGNFTIESGGLMVLNQKLDIGLDPGCGYTLVIRNGGSLSLNGSGGSDLLSICGEKIAQSGGGCNDCGGTNSGTCAYDGQPYCEPSGGFSGPLGYGEDGYDEALPVELLFFKAKINNSSVKLEWATSKEEGFDRFYVERSSNGSSFETIGEVRGAGYNTEEKNEYSLIDGLPLVGRNYYRLKAVDLDGSVEYFGIRTVEFAGQKKVYVYPNPALGESVNFKSNFAPGENDQVLVINQFGVEVARMPVKNKDSEFQFAGKLSAGVYMIKYVSGDQNYVSRFVVRD